VALEFKLPDLGEGIAEGEITTWLVQEGQTVEEDQPMVEVMTDKATVEITSPRAGTVLKLMVEEGTTVAIGTRILGSGDPGEEVPAGGTAEPAAAAPAPAEGAPVPAKAAPAAPAPAKAAPAAPAPAKAPPAPAQDVTPAFGMTAGARPGGKALATPSVRRLARERGIDIDRVPGSGPAGRVVAEDLDAFARGPVAGTAPPVPGGEERFKLKGIRKRITEVLSESVHKAVHVTHIEEIDVRRLVELRNAARPQAEAEGVKLTYLPFIIKALIATLKRFPMFNATLDEERGEIVWKRYYHIGVAVATDRGLLVPVVRDADRKTVVELAREIVEKAEATRDGTIGVEDLQNSTFSITNYGAIGGLFATPIINFPEAAILGLGTIRERPVVRDGQIVVRPMMYAGITFDHRITDGAEGARFMDAFKRNLEEPALILMEQ
jgi:pyruvate dehydrogenase E2 component (dihydrolipoamide acetyltransferase)